MRRQIVTALVTVLTVGLIVFFVVREGSITALRGLEPGSIAVLLALSVLILVVRGLQFANVATPFGVRLGPGEATGLSAMHTLSNYLPARGGIVVRGAYLREIHGLAVADYTAMLALWLFGSLISAVVIGLVVGLTGLLSTGVMPTTGVFGLLGAGLLALWLLVERTTRLSSGTGRLARFGGRMNRGLRVAREPAAWRRWFLVYSFGLIVVGGVRYWFALRVLGSEASFLDALVVQSLMSMSILLSITPGNIGIREGVGVFGASLVAMEVDVALLAAVVDRALGLAVSVLGFGLLGRPLVRGIRRRSGHAPGDDDD